MVPTSGRLAGHMPGYLADFLYRRMHPQYSTRLHDLMLSLSLVQEVING